MSFFNDLGKKISETSQGAVNKTKAMAETSRLNSAINDCKNKIDMAYREIGNFYVNKYGENPNPEVADKVNMIKELEGNIKNMQEEIRKINGYAVCPKCGKTVRNDAFFCDGCGEKLRSQEPDNRCAFCGATLQPNASFCTKCGKPRNAAPQPQPQPQPQPPYQPPYGGQPFNGQPKMNMDGQPVNNTENVQETAPAKKICPVCGYELDANQEICLRCGERL